MISVSSYKETHLRHLFFTLVLHAPRVSTQKNHASFRFRFEHNENTSLAGATEGDLGNICKVQLCHFWWTQCPCRYLVQRDYREAPLGIQ